MLDSINLVKSDRIKLTKSEKLLLLTSANIAYRKLKSIPVENGEIFVPKISCQFYVTTSSIGAITTGTDVRIPYNKIRQITYITKGTTAVDIAFWVINTIEPHFDDPLIISDTNIVAIKDALDGFFKFRFMFPLPIVYKPLDGVLYSIQNNNIRDSLNLIKSIKKADPYSMSIDVVLLKIQIDAGDMETPKKLINLLFDTSSMFVPLLAEMLLEDFTWLSKFQNEVTTELRNCNATYLTYRKKKYDCLSLYEQLIHNKAFCKFDK